MDGMQKAFGRAMCTGEFLWQQDADEIVHEDDYAKIRKLVKMFPPDTDLVHLPIVELWGDENTVRTDRHSWKWRLSRNDFRITHGIHASARVLDEKTGKVFAKKGASDSCEYIDIVTGEYIPHRGFYNQNLEFLRATNPQEYGKKMNEIFDAIPSVYHTSWMNVEKKVKSFKDFWNVFWSNMYNDPNPVDRFPDVVDEGSLKRVAEEIKLRGGEHGPAQVFKLDHSCPKLLKDWIDGNK
jgi:hypothetical protein